MHEIGVRETVQFAGLTFNWETLEMTWITMAIVLLIAFLATRSLKLVPSGWQNVVEMVVTALAEQSDTMLGKRGQFLSPFIVTLFLFLLVSNWVGLVPTMASPTNDLNTTLGLALLVICMVHVRDHQRDRRGRKADHAGVPSFRQHSGGRDSHHRPAQTHADLDAGALGSVARVQYLHRRCAGGHLYDAVDGVSC